MGQKGRRPGISPIVLDASMACAIHHHFVSTRTRTLASPSCRAKNGVGLIVTGGIAPNRQGKLSPFAAKLTNPLEVGAAVLIVCAHQSTSPPRT